MAFVLFRYPSVEFMLRDEDLRLSEPALAPVVCGGADGIHLLRVEAQELAAQVLGEG